MNQTPEVIVFEEGDRVPEWLIRCDPASPGAGIVEYVFTGHTLVIDDGGRYFIVPQHIDRSFFRLRGNGSGNLTMGAGSHKPVIVPVRFMEMFPQGSGLGGTIKVA
jgi:hypothetical protein